MTLTCSNCTLETSWLLIQWLGKVHILFKLVTVASNVSGQCHTIFVLFVLSQIATLLMHKMCCSPVSCLQLRIARTGFSERPKCLDLIECSEHEIANECQMKKEEVLFYSLVYPWHALLLSCIFCDTTVGPCIIILVCLGLWEAVLFKYDALFGEFGFFETFVFSTQHLTCILWFLTWLFYSVLWPSMLHEVLSDLAAVYF